jgi:signal peptidase I
MTSIIQNIMEENPGIFILVLFILFIGAVGKAKLFAKADQPWIAALVPVWDLIVVLRMVGRPLWHAAFFLIPGFNIYFGFKLLIEIAQSFGKVSMIDAIFVCFFNVFYVLNLGLAYNELYYGPVYGVDVKDVLARKPALV